MGWGPWSSDSSGGGETREKTESSGGRTESHTLRTEDNAKEGSRNDHSHVIVTEHESGRTTAHGHGIFGGRRK